MKSEYMRLLSVDIRHQYFHDGKCRGLYFSFDQETRSIAKMYDMFLKNHGNEMTIYYNNALVSAILSDCPEKNSEMILTIEVFTQDIHYLNYTDENTTYDVYSNKKDTDELAGENLPKNSRLLNNTNRNGCKLFDIRIGINAPEISRLQPMCFTLHLPNRKTYWKYFISCSGNNRKFIVKDLLGKCTFTEGATMSDSIPEKTIYTYKSDNTIDINEKPLRRFKLIEMINSNKQKEIMTLSGAEPINLYADNDNSDNLVSYIFINL